MSVAKLTATDDGLQSSSALLLPVPSKYSLMMRSGASPVGARVGDFVGEDVGVLVGARVGDFVGEDVGALVGMRVGVSVADNVGGSVGTMLEKILGLTLGALLATTLGLLLGALLATTLGFMLGALLATTLGVLLGSLLVGADVGVAQVAGHDFKFVNVSTGKESYRTEASKASLVTVSLRSQDFLRRVTSARTLG